MYGFDWEVRKAFQARPCGKRVSWADPVAGPAHTAQAKFGDEVVELSTLTNTELKALTAAPARASGPDKSIWWGKIGEAELKIVWRIDYTKMIFR